MLAHRNKMKHIPNELTHGVELNVERRGKNIKDWEKLFNNPTAGISFLATNAGNDKIMGNAFGLNGYILVPLIKSKSFRLVTSWGWGLGYITKKFDPVNNHRNNTIGSNLNLFAAIKLTSEIKVANQVFISLGASFHHWSNSGFKQPNLGLNLPSANLGLVYKFHNTESYTKLTKSEKKDLTLDKKNEFSIIPSIGFRSVSEHDPNIYPAYTLSLNYSRLWSPMYKISIGYDFFYNLANKKLLENSEFPELREKSAFQMGLNINYNQTFGKFSILIGPGIYTYNETGGDKYYVKFGTRYAINDRIILNTILHTHWARADHFKLGIGYKIRK